MAVNDTDTNLALEKIRSQDIEITDAFPMRLQVLDLARHTAVAPDGNRFVVATFDDRRIGQGYITEVYPQQNKYLTLIRLLRYQVSSAKPEEAIKRHSATVQAIQQGKLAALRKKS